MSSSSHRTRCVSCTLCINMYSLLQSTKITYLSERTSTLAERKVVKQKESQDFSTQQTASILLLFLRLPEKENHFFPHHFPFPLIPPLSLSSVQFPFFTLALSFTLSTLNPNGNFSFCPPPPVRLLTGQLKVVRAGKNVNTDNGITTQGEEDSDDYTIKEQTYTKQNSDKVAA